MKRRFIVNDDLNLDSKDAKIPKIIDTKCVNKSKKSDNLKTTFDKKSQDIDNFDTPMAEYNELDDDFKLFNKSSNFKNQSIKIRKIRDNESDSDIDISTTPPLSPIRKSISNDGICIDENSSDSFASISSEVAIKTLTNGLPKVSTYNLSKNDIFNEIKVEMNDEDRCKLLNNFVNTDNNNNFESSSDKFKTKNIPTNNTKNSNISKTFDETSKVISSQKEINERTSTSKINDNNDNYYFIKTCNLI